MLPNANHGNGAASKVSWRAQARRLVLRGGTIIIFTHFTSYWEPFIQELSTRYRPTEQTSSFSSSCSVFLVGAVNTEATKHEQDDSTIVMAEAATEVSATMFLAHLGSSILLTMSCHNPVGYV